MIESPGSRLPWKENNVYASVRGTGTHICVSLLTEARSVHWQTKGGNGNKWNACTYFMHQRTRCCGQGLWSSHGEAKECPDFLINTIYRSTWRTVTRWSDYSQNNEDHSDSAFMKPALEARSDTWTPNYCSLAHHRYRRLQYTLDSRRRSGKRQWSRFSCKGLWLKVFCQREAFT